MKKILLLIGIFIMGFVSHMTILEVANLEMPFSTEPFPIDKEVDSPQDWIKEDQIHVYDTHIVLDIENATWAKFTNTNSMDPLLDETSNGIEIIPQSEFDLELGDVVAYESEFSSGIIIHRIVDKGFDDDGTFFITKGDNNLESDPGKVRFDQIKRVLVGVIY